MIVKMETIRKKPNNTIWILLWILSQLFFLCLIIFILDCEEKNRKISFEVYSAVTDKDRTSSFLGVNYNYILTMNKKDFYVDSKYFHSVSIGDSVKVKVNGRDEVVDLQVIKK